MDIRIGSMRWTPYSMGSPYKSPWEGAAREYFADARNAFRDWRYPHEKQFLVASDESLARLGMVRDTVKELRPGLVSVFETA